MKIAQLTRLLWLVESSVRHIKPTLSNTVVEDTVLLAKVMDSLKLRAGLTGYLLLSCLFLCYLLTPSFCQLLPFPFSPVLSTSISFLNCCFNLSLLFTIIHCNKLTVTPFYPRWMMIFWYWYLHPLKKNLRKGRNCIKIFACPASLAKSLEKPPVGINIKTLGKENVSQTSTVCCLWT